jgi:type II secretory pathway component PulJ
MKLFSFQKRRATRGFTLAEVTVGSTVSGVIAATCFISYLAIHRLQTATLARSEVRANVIRIFDFLETDLHNAKTVAGTTSGSQSVFPLTLSVPQRYSTFVSSGPFAGDPGRSATRIAPTLNATTGKIVNSSSVTVLYESVAKTGSQDIKRTVTWTEAGIQKTSSRIIATVPANTTLTFRSGTSTSASPAPIKSTDYSMVAQLSAPFVAFGKGSTSPTTMESTIFLRQKSLK